MTINLSVPHSHAGLDLKPRITVIGVGGAGGNAVNNMIRAQLTGVEFVVANTDAQALTQSQAERRVQLGSTITQGLGAGSRPDVGRIAAEEAMEQIIEEIRGSNMAFIAAGMGGGTGTGAAPVIAKAAREQGILTVGVVTKPFHFEGNHRMRVAEAGIEELEQFVDTLIIIPNQNLFRVANERTTFADAFKMADDVLYSGVRGVTDLMVMPGHINLDFADIRAVMSEMGKAMMGTGEADGDRRALEAAEAAISNPLLDDMSMKGARGVLINITGGPDMTLFEVDEAANRIRTEMDSEAFVIFGSTIDPGIEGRMRVSVVATGMAAEAHAQPAPTVLNLAEAAGQHRGRQAGGLGVGGLGVGGLGKVAAFGDGRSAVGGIEATGGEDAAVYDPDLPVAAHLREGGEDEDAVAAGDAFIPAAPVARGASGQPAGPRETELVAEEPRSRPRVANLFARVTGAGRYGRAQPAEAPLRPAGDSASQPQAGREHPRRLGAADPEERLPQAQPAEDLLDIPAFLRRQAN
ncbi:MAG: cell division protein FtsZ [Rhodospirillales bacterium]|nr:MAG: cell division protein FtsZ [Rhodospirillales bacterium]